MVDDFCHSHLPTKKPGPQASLCASEVITLAIFARWGRFSSERNFYRYARTCLYNAFPTLPDRSQFNRLVRSHAELMKAFIAHLVAVRARPNRSDMLKAESLRSRRAEMLTSRLQGGVLTCLHEERYEVRVALFEQRELGVFGLLVCL
jgi:hypothetical protein